MELTEIRETVKILGNVRTVKEIDNQQFEDRSKKLSDRTSDYAANKIPDKATSEIPRAFLEGDPSKAYINLIELRSGRSLSDKTGPFKHSVPLIDIENQQSHFSQIYRNYNRSFLRTMGGNPGLDLKKIYVFGGCVEAALRELGCREFILHKNKLIDESPTAYSINTHLRLIYSVSAQESLKPKLSADLLRCGYLPVLKEFIHSSYVLHILESIVFDTRD